MGSGVGQQADGALNLKKMTSPSSPSTADLRGTAHEILEEANYPALAMEKTKTPQYY